jgi:membrane-bound lytic murein transglycosylase B
VALGRKALAANAALLDRIEAEYGVEKEVVAAIWGLESAYGTYRGDTDTVSALATLAYDGRRAAFFEGQLVLALKILTLRHARREDLRGSWAGAMGHTQFMPSSWTEFAVDFDGDGRHDIWSDDPTDALASTANYLRHWGWTKGQPWGLEVVLPAGFDYDQTTERVKKPVADWQALGVRPMAGGDLPEGPEASVLLPAGHTGPAFLIFPNFQVIEKYNLADAYVIGIGHLSDRLRGGPPVAAPWPRHWRALTLEERRELQSLLVARGPGYRRSGRAGRAEDHRRRQDLAKGAGRRARRLPQPRHPGGPAQRRVRQSRLGGHRAPARRRCHGPDGRGLCRWSVWQSLRREYLEKSKPQETGAPGLAF